MQLNYLKIAWRNLVKNRFFTLLNIAGLAIGVACFLLICLYVTDELSYDRYHEKADRIYRINSDIIFGGTELKLAVASDPMGAALKKDYPEVEEFARIYASEGSKMIKKSNAFIQEQNVAYADSTFFDVFTFPAIEGDTHTALNEPNTVVISASAAEKYFGTTHAMGKFVELNDDKHTLYKVTAVIRDMPLNSHFRYDFLFSMDNVDYGFGNYLSHNFVTYLLFKKGTDIKAFEKKFPAYVNKYILPQAQGMMQLKSMEEFEKQGNKLAYHLIPLTDIHLHSDRSAELSVNGNIQYVYIFSAVAIFILLIACVNFMNLSTARSANRSREVGIRKVLGSEKNTLVRQFLAESTLVSFIAILFAVGITILSLPYFNGISGKMISISKISSPGFLIFLVCLPFVIGLLAGTYPAFYLSSFNPITVLKGKLNAGAKKSRLRSALVVFQFATSIILMAGTIVVYKQLNYIQNKKIGFNKEQVLTVEGTWTLGNNYQAFRNEIEKIPGVSGSTQAGYLPVGSSSRNDNTFFKEAVMDVKGGFNMQHWRVDENYIPLMGMEIVAGRNFSKTFGSDSNAIIINESTAQLLGYKNPVGQIIYSGENQGQAPVPKNIIGVVKNFNFESMKQRIAPLCLTLGNANWVTAFKVDSHNLPATIREVEKKWTAMAPAMPFRYEFLDEAFSNMYNAEQRAGKVVLSFSILAILIACLGLFGLASYMAEQRTKEIGVRKVLGATVNNIVTMMSKDFMKLVGIAAVFAIPLAAWLMHFWLQDFAYRINLSWWIFAVASIIAILIALFTISFQAISAALTNPVKSLRSE
jgi:putative ABC transport system permease protein